ncbi:MAG: hypothetical protein ABEH64_08010, partial [Salinirussus sp.]
MTGSPAADQLPRPLRIVFGDRLGLTIFLVGLIFFGITWRLGFFIVDSRTIANLVANLADGRLAVVEAPYSLTAANQPGLVEAGGRLYGRNYGIAYLAVPATWFFETIHGIFTLRVIIGGFWALGLVAVGRTTSVLLDWPGLAKAGALAGLVAVAVTILFRTPATAFDEPAPLLGLQLTTMLVAAYGGTLLYRLLADRPRVGVAAGFGLLFASPIGFWGTIPKRHVVTATLLLLACLCFATSTRRDGHWTVLGRGGAYATLAFLGSIHAFEAAFMLAVLIPVDLATHRHAPLHEHALVACIFLIGAIPVLATNFAIAGDPMTTPRMLPAADGSGPRLGTVGVGPADGGSVGSAGSATDGGGSSLGGPQTGTSSGSSPLAIPLVAGLVGQIAWIVGYMLDSLTAGLADLGQLGGLYHTVVRSGWIPGVRYAVNGWEAVELSLLEAVPLLAILVAGPALLVADIPRQLRESVQWPTWRPVDALALAMASVFFIV